MSHSAEGVYWNAPCLRNKMDNPINIIEVKRIRVALALLFLSPKQIKPARKGKMIATASKVPSVNSLCS
jgi:hypothetical protein